MESHNAEINKLVGRAILSHVDEYDVIGFDVDHTLATYNIPNLVAMTFRALTRILVDELSYPASIKEVSPELLVLLGENNLILRV